MSTHSDQMKAPSTEYVLESTVYKHLLDSARDHIYKEEQRQSELQTLTNQVDVLTRLNQEWKTEFDVRNQSFPLLLSATYGLSTDSVRESPRRIQRQG